MRKKKRKIRFVIRRWIHGFIAVTAVLTLLFSVGIGILIGYIHTLPPIEQLERYSPPQATAIYDRTGEIRIATLARQNRDVIPLDKMPEILKKAFIAVEDKRFYNHFGVDFLRTARAIMIDIKRRRAAQGASTITQQLPRNILKSVSRRKIISRKIKETLLALQIERRYSKDQILEFYLNQIYLGNGAYGVQAAARTFFDKDVSELNLSESAVLAAIPKRPASYSPLNNIKASTRRRNIILNLMYKQGIVSRTEYEDAVSSSIQLAPPPPPVYRAPYFIEHVRRSLVKTEQLDNESLYRDGYIIHTTLDGDLQKIADEELGKGLRAAEILRRDNAVKLRLPVEKKEYGNLPPVPGQKRLAKVSRIFTDTLNVELGGYYGSITLPDHPPYYQLGEILEPGKWIDVIPTDVDKSSRTFFAELADDRPLQGAVVILDARSGEIRAMCGGENFYDLENNGMWNRATQGRGRQPGSAIKPLFFSCALENGYTLASTFNDRKIVFPDGYSPRNYENMFFGKTTLEEALEHSRNVVTVLLYRALGPERALPFVARFDILGERPEWVLPRDPTVSLGSLTATPLSLTAAYFPFVHRGVGIRPIAVTRVIGPDGKEAVRLKSFEREVISPRNAHMMTYALQGVMERGTGRKYIGEELKGEPGIPALAGKSGTTNNCVDAWFVGFTPDLVIGVWVGFDKNISMGNKMTGSRVAGPIWREIVRRASRLDRDWTMDFPDTGNIVYRDICSESGLVATNSCIRSPDGVIYKNMPFLKGTEPTKVCTLH